MSYGGHPYGGVAYAGSDVAEIPQADTEPTLAVEVAFTTDALDPNPAWVDVTGDVRSFDVNRGRNRELERFQPGRATVVLDNRLRQYDSVAPLPTQYIDLPGTSGNYASTLDSAAVSITGDIDIRVRVALDDWTPATNMTLIGKWIDSTDRSWTFRVATDGTLRSFISTTGANVEFDSAGAATGFTNGTTHWVRMTREASSGDIEWFTSDDGEAWVQLGTTQASTAGGLFDNNAAVQIGTYNNGAEPLAGNVYYAEVRNGIDGPVAAKFDANTVPQTGTRTPSSWTSETGEVWTVNGTTWAWGGAWGSKWFPNIRPMRRIRIRETFNGVTYPVFDGFVDRWQLDYPNVGKDATAAVTATDAFKIFARTDLPPSVYQLEVEADNPDIWWRFDDPQYLFSAVDASGNDRTGTPEGEVRFGGETLIVHDPGSSLQLEEAANTNVEVSHSVNAANPFGFEFWFKWDKLPAGSSFLVMALSGGNGLFNFQINPITFKAAFAYRNDAGSNFSAQPNFTFVVGRRYHIFCTHLADRVLRVFIDGAEAAYDVQETTSGATTITTVAVGSSNSSAANRALVDEFALYTTAVPDSVRIGVHRGAGIAPWENDLPGDRLPRVLDLAEWPSALREIDEGATDLQTASIAGQTVLEHAQKVAETEFGLLYIDRAGNVRFVSRSALFARVAAPEVFGDETGEIGYREFTPDDGDEVIRNRATISRLDGVAKTDFDQTSIDEFGRFDYVLDGLLHDTEAHSLAYAEFIVAEYKDPRRRITDISIGPSISGLESTVYPAMLGRELGDAITVRNRPIPGGDTFEQVCAIEGIRMSGSPKILTVRWMLSPEFTESF